MASRRLTDIKDFPFIHRCCCSVWSGHPHCIHSGHSVRADRSDLTHPACDDRCDPGQRRGPGAPTIAVRLHHSHQEAPLSAWAGDGTSWVSLLMLLSSFAVILHLFSLFLFHFLFIFLSLIFPFISFPYVCRCLINLYLLLHVSGSIISVWRTSWSEMCATSLLTLPIGICKRC